MPPAIPPDSLSQLIFSSAPIQVVATSASVSLVPSALAIGSPSYAIARKPAGSSASLTGGTFTADLPGLYVCTVTIGAVAQTVSVIALSATAFALKNSAGAPLNFLALFTTNAGWNATTFTATVESASPVAGGITPALFGGSNNSTSIPLNNV
jgi:hypothetical protein